MLALIVVILVVILLLPGCGNRTAKVAGEVQATTLVEVGDTAPDFVVGMFDGTQVRLSELRGKVVLLNFWATWCPPCRAELARVGTDVIERFAGRDFVFLPFRGASRAATWRPSAKRTDTTFRWVSTRRRRSTASMPRNTSPATS